MSELDTAATVKALMSAAGLNPPPEAMETFIKLYPGLRKMADALYEIPEVRYEEPALIYSPLG